MGVMMARITRSHTRVWLGSFPIGKLRDQFGTESLFCRCLAPEPRFGADSICRAEKHVLSQLVRGTQLIASG